MRKKSCSHMASPFKRYNNNLLQRRSLVNRINMKKRISLFIITNYSQLYERRYFNLIHKLNSASYILIYLITSQYHAAIVKLFYVNVLSYEYSVYYMYEGNEINCHHNVKFNFCVMSYLSFVPNYKGSRYTPIIFIFL